MPRFLEYVLYFLAVLIGVCLPPVVVLYVLSVWAAGSGLTFVGPGLVPVMEAMVVCVAALFALGVAAVSLRHYLSLRQEQINGTIKIETATNHGLALGFYDAALKNGQLKALLEETPEHKELILEYMRICMKTDGSEVTSGMSAAS